MELVINGQAFGLPKNEADSRALSTILR
jgi:hypothetical protein